MIMPDNCSSLTCRTTEYEYCKKCSHAIWYGEGEHNGKIWKWEFTPMFGPLFLRKDGEPLKHQPIHEDHPAWKPFIKWFNKIKG
jgi:hypothetical protein